MHAIFGKSLLAIEMGAKAENIGLSIHPLTLTETVANATDMFSVSIINSNIPKDN